MSKMKKAIALLLAIVMVLALGSLSAGAADETVSTMPTVLPDGTAAQVKTALHFNDDENAVFVNDAESTYDTMAAAYGFTADGAVSGKALELVTAGAKNSAQVTISYSGESCVNVEGCQGLMFYVDMSGLRSDKDGMVGITVGLSAGAKVTGGSSTYLSTQGAFFSYTMNSSTAYYYDAATDKWVETTNNIEASRMAVPAEYKGWMYIPFTSYYLNGFNTGDSYTMQKHGLDKNKKFIRSVFVYSGGYDAVESGTRVILDELCFVAAGDAHTHKYGSAVNTAATCGADGTSSKTCSDCGFVNTVATAKTEHKWGSWTYDAANAMKVRVCSECGEHEAVVASAADSSLPAYDAAQYNTAAVVFDYNNGDKAVMYVEKGSTIDMDELAYPFDYSDGADHYIFNCWTLDKEGLNPSNPQGVTVNGDMNYFARWAYDTGYFYQPGYKIETSEGGVYNASTENKGKVIFYGSSNFRTWKTLIPDMGEELPSLNHGISGCNDTHLLANLTRLVLAFEPKIVVINCSTNDLVSKMTDDEIKANKEELYNTIHDMYPETVIVFTSHMPLPAYKGTANQPRMEKLNVWVKEFCDTHDRCEYLDVYTDIVDLGSEYFKDTLHFSAKGQELYGNMIKTALLDAVEKHNVVFDTAKSGMDNFANTAEYVSGTFTDVTADAWYASSVESVYELGLMNGVADNAFDPKGSLTVAQAVVMAARVHKIYTEGNGEFAPVEGAWYTAYTDYAVANGIIGADDFSDYTAEISRAQMAYIFSNALPEAELAATKSITAIPDVTLDAQYGADIFMLYNAGILNGSDAEGTFNPDSSINRAEAATIIARVAVVSQRK